MRPTMIEVEGFCSYLGRQQVDLARVDFGIIVGENGAGKSTMLNAITFALFGTPRVSGDIDSVVHPQADRAVVSVEFEFDDRTFLVTRQRVKGKRTTASLAKLDENGHLELLADGSVRLVDDEIEKLLRMDHATFAATVMLGQGDADRFAAATASERKQLLGKIIGLDRYQVLADRARDAANAARVSASEQDAVAAQIEGRLVSADHDATALGLAQGRLADAVTAEDEMREKVQVLRSERERVIGAINGYDRQIDARLAELGQSRVSVERDAVDATRAVNDASVREARQRAALEDAQTQAAGRDAAVAGLDAVCAAQRDRETAIEQTRERGQVARGDLDTATARKVALAAEIVVLSERRELLGDNHVDASDSGACWVCNQDLPAEARAEVLAAIDSGLATLRAQSTEAAESARTASARRESLKTEYTDIVRAHKSADEQISSMQRRVAELDSVSGRVIELLADLTIAEKEHATALDVLACAETASADLPDPESDHCIVTLRGHVAEANSVLDIMGDLAPHEATAADAARQSREYTAQVAQYSERCAQHGRDRAALAEVNVTRERFHADEKTFYRLREAFGRDGIPAMIFGEVVAALSEHVNDTLTGLSDGQLAVELTTTRATKKGDERDTLDVNVICADGVRNFASLSGGEKQRVAVALRLGLARLLVHRHGTSIDFLAIDEGWGALDASGVAAMSDCLAHLRNEFGLILTVTHIDAVKDSFATVIEVVKTAAGSEVMIR